jgi:hypothetical protein
MPNWCFNRLTVDTTSEGGKKLAKAFEPKYASEGTGEFEFYAKPMQDLMPCPQVLLDTPANLAREHNDQQKSNIAKHGYSDWYSWCVANWGTKWDARVVEFDDFNPNQTYVMFDTAWSPPENFFKIFAMLHPDAYFRNEFDEEGMSFEGYCENSQAKGFVCESWDLNNGEEDEE